MRKSKDRIADAAQQAAKAANSALVEELKDLVDEEIELQDSNDDSSPKYKIVHGVSIQQYGGQIVRTSGMLDPTGTVIAVAIARPGSTRWSNTRGNTMSRTTMFGDVAVYGFDSANRKVGINVMPSKSWMVMQSRSSTGEELRPFLRTPWDVRQNVVSQTGSLQPPTFDTKIRNLCDAAINLAAVECSKRIKENKPSQTQENYSAAVAAAEEMAKAISTRQSTSNTFSQNNDSLSSTAAELFN